MSGTGERQAGAANTQNLPYDPATLLSLYGMSAGLYGGGGASLGPPTTISPASPLPPSTTLGVAVSQAQSLGLNSSSAAWWNMAGQLAAQEYLSRIQAAARDPATFSALAAQGAMPGFRCKEGKEDEPNSGLLENLKLPTDTEIIRRKKSVDSSTSPHSSFPNLPAGLTIEKKRPGRKPLDPNYHVPSSGSLVDKVEITKIPASNGALDMSRKNSGTEKEEKEGGRKRTDEDAPLNLSIKSDTDSDYNSGTIPSEYYASQALSGVFLAEQIRQQQLATQLQNHLQVPGGLTAMQALLSLTKYQAADQNADYGKRQSDLKSKNLGRGNVTVKPKKNTVASLLAQTRGGERPELTIEPVYRKGDSPLHWKPSLDTQTRQSSERDSEDGQNSDYDDFQDSNGASRQKGRQIVTDTEDLKVPLRSGWIRETTIREFSKSGIRGEVVYVAPCGKRFKQYPDIIRYVEKRGINGINRTHFSFSTKLIVGDFLKPSGRTDSTGEEKFERFTDDQMNDEIDRIRKENGWKPRKRGKLNGGSGEGGGGNRGAARRSNGVESGASSSLEDHVKLIQTLQEEEQRRRLEQEQQRLEKEALRILKEAEKREKLEMLKRERERSLEEKKRKQEELIRQRQEEKMKKLQEIEMKRQQAALVKEQDRERRRQHMLLIKQFDTRKRNEERRKRIEELKVEREREKERRQETRRMELEILSEMKRPVEDMALPDPRPLPEVPRIPGLKLSGECFANTLMVFEFLHNFGETLGFDMDSLPSMSSLQSALLNEDMESEEEFLSVMTHLVVCAIEDPGVPNPLKQLTILGQNLKQADITNTNITEILRVYLRARAQYELKLFHGVTLTEPKDRKEALMGPFSNADESYLKLLKENKTYQMSEWLSQKPFLCINPSEKIEIVAFLCNELLSNKAVVNQIEVTMENLQVMKRKKLALDNKVKKLRILHNRKFRYKAGEVTGRLLDVGDASVGSHNGSNILPATPTITDSEIHSDKEDSMSVMSDSTRHSETANQETPVGRAAGGRAAKRKKGNGGGGRGGKKKVEEPPVVEEPSDEDNSDIDLSDEEGKEDEEDNQLTAEDLQKKIERMVKLAKKKTEDLNFVSNTLRASDLGQDRFRRRYWQLAHSGGLFLEGLESGEPWKLENRGLQAGSEVSETVGSSGSLSPPAKKLKLEHEDPVIKDEENKENKVFDTSTPQKALAATTPPSTTAPSTSLSSGTITTSSSSSPADILRNAALTNQLLLGLTPVKPESMTADTISALNNGKKLPPILDTPTTPGRFTPKVTPNGERLNMFNHSAYFNMSLSPVILNGTVTVTPREGGANTGIMNHGSGNGGNTTSFGIAHVDRNQDRPWFNLVAVGESGDDEYHPGRARHSGDTSLPHLSLLEKKLTMVKQMNTESDRKPIPTDKCYGWWKLNSDALISQIESAILQKGTREQHLLLNLRKGFEIVQESSKKVEASEIDLIPPFATNGGKMEPETTCFWPLVEVIPGAATADTPASWSRDVALRVEKYILEQVEALEDKVASASMQVPGWKIPDRPLVDTLKFRPSCQTLKEGVKEEEEEEELGLNAVEVAKKRLLELEAAIERRYLKSPLGASKQASLQNITANAEKNKNDDTMDSEEKDENDDASFMDEEDKENKEENGGCDTDTNKENTGGEGEESGKSKAGQVVDEGIPRGLASWREAVRAAQNAAQLAMAFYVLETCVAWDKSIMKASCQFCDGGENENALLLCDSCDRGYHTYCFKPPITTIPEGDWYCFECVNKATGERHCLVCGKEEEENLVLCSACPRAYHTACINPPLAKTPRGKWHCPACNEKGPRKGSKKARSMRNTDEADEESEKDPGTPAALVETTPATPPPPPKSAESPAPRAAKKKSSRVVKLDKDLTICHTLLSELAGHDESWPFMNPVNTKQFPTYKKIIKNPMDISTIRKKLNDGMYKAREEFREDVCLIFKNCELFNEDSSPVGKAGHKMRTFFESRWSELTS